MTSEFRTIRPLISLQVPLKKLACMKVGQNKTDLHLNLIVIFGRNSPVAMWISRQILVFLYQLNLDYTPLCGEVKLKAGQDRSIHRCNSKLFKIHVGGLLWGRAKFNKIITSEWEKLHSTEIQLYVVQKKKKKKNPQKKPGSVML